MADKGPPASLRFVSVRKHSRLQNKSDHQMLCGPILVQENHEDPAASISLSSLDVKTSAQT